MCTVIYIKALGVLCKNRDKENPEEETVVHENGVLGVKSVGSGYLSLGINRHGVAFVSTAVNCPEWMRAVESGDRSMAKAILVEELDGLVRPTLFVSERFESMKCAEDLAGLIAAEPSNWMPYNIVAADSHRAFHLELYKDRRIVHSLPDRYFVTNHFFGIPYGPVLRDDYPSSFNRYDACADEVPLMKTREDVQAFLYRSDRDEDRSVWRKGVYDTVSATVIDLGEKAMVYSGERNGPWKRFHQNFNL